jgi:hypothetical protein
LSRRRALRRWGRRRAPLTLRSLDRQTWATAVLAAGTAGAALAGEVARVWRRGSAPLPAEAEDVVAAARVAARETGEVALEGLRATPNREEAAFNLLLSFLTTAVFARVSAYEIRRRGTFGPFRNVVVGNRHVHHFVPGIAMAFLAGGASIVSRNEELDKWLAVPFGAGMGLTLDESALLLELDDVYWTEEGVASIQISAITLALLGALTLGRRVFRRGEERVLGPPEALLGP